MTKTQNDSPNGTDQATEATQLVPANDNVPGPKPGKRWECYCGRTRANPYGRPYLDDVGRIQGNRYDGTTTRP